MQGNRPTEHWHDDHDVQQQQLRIAKRLAKSAQGASWFKIASAVFVGNLLAMIAFAVLGWAIMIFVAHAFHQEMLNRIGSTSTPSVQTEGLRAMTPEEMRAQRVMQERQTAQQQAQQRQRAEQQRQAQAEQQARQRLINQTRELCEFWRGEYAKDRSEASAAYRDVACQRYARVQSN